MATTKQQRAIDKLVETRGSVSAAMRKAGYSPKSAKNPKNLTESKAWQKLVTDVLSDEKLLAKHAELLDATGIDHMVFPLSMTDEMIRKLLKSANCIVKKFQHSETQTHVWFFAADNKARKDALDMAYKLRGKYAPEKKDIRQVTLNLSPEKSEMVEKALGSFLNAQNRPADSS